MLLAVGRLRDPSPYLAVDGEVAALHRPRKYAALLDGAVAELVHHGRDAPRVLGRLDAVLEELRGAVRPEHRAATDAALARLRTARRAGDGEDEGEPVR